MSQPIYLAREGFVPRMGRWKQLHAITMGPSGVIERIIHAEPALLGGWRYTRVDVHTGADSWPDYDVADVVRWRLDQTGCRLATEIEAESIARHLESEL